MGSSGIGTLVPPKARAPMLSIWMTFLAAGLPCARASGLVATVSRSAVESKIEWFGMMIPLESSAAALTCSSNLWLSWSEAGPNHSKGPAHTCGHAAREVYQGCRSAS